MSADKIVPFKPKSEPVIQPPPLNDFVPTNDLRWNGNTLEQCWRMVDQYHWRPIPIKAQDEPEESPNSPIV